MFDSAQVSKLSLLASALLLGALCIVAIITATSGDNARPEAALAPSVTLAPPPVATEAPATPGSSGPRLPHPPAPTQTVEPGRGLQETTLVDLQTGQTTPLWQDYERVGRIAFSPDGRWLVFYRSRGSDDSSFQLYRMDLQSTDHRIELLAKGFLYSSGSLSSRGDLAFAQPQPDGSFRTAVMLPDGTVHELGSAGHFTSWSPDGRWLSYEAPYEAEDQPMTQYLVDIQTWKESGIGASLPCNCDGNPRPIWAPDSEHYIYPYITGEVGSDRHTAYELRTAGNDAQTRSIDRAVAWLDSQHYVERIGGNSPDSPVQVSSVDIETGQKTPLFPTVSGRAFGIPAPDWTRYAGGSSQL